MMLCVHRKGAVKKAEGIDDGNGLADAKAVKPEAKDEDTDDSDMEGKCQNNVEGEEADVRDVIYNLEIFVWNWSQIGY